MAVANRSARLHRLTSQLAEEFGLRPREVEAEYDERRRVWSIQWLDGPTAGQMQRAAKKRDAEVLTDVTFRRDYTNPVWALAAIRMAMAAEEAEDFPWISAWEARRWLDKVKNPRPRNERERAMATRLVEASVSSTSSYPDDERMCKLVSTKGIAWLLRGGTEEAPALSPIELLTDRYASGKAHRAWAARLVPLTPLEAFGIVQADPEAPADVVAAALTLVPELHAALDTAAAALRARSEGS
ncbi:hypothetical protein ACWDZ4_20270 [Streptomyces sp. NPDC003016]